VLTAAGGRLDYAILQTAVLIVMMYTCQSLVLSQFLSLLSSIRLQAEREQAEAERAKAEAERAKAEAETKEARAATIIMQLERAVAEIGRQQMELMSTASQRHHSGGILNGITTIPRIRKLRKAWTDGDRWHASTGEPEEGVGSKFSCLAVTSEDCITFEARILKKTGEVGKEMKIKPGSHAFVVMEGESFLRVSLMAAEFGKAAGHPQLALEQPCLYAGEIEFDEDQKITRWNNMSGTYKSSDSMAYQARLPLDKFWALVPTPSAEEESAHRVCIKDPEGKAVWIEKIIDFHEEDFIRVHVEWVGYQDSLFESNSAANACDARLSDMAKQLRNAIKSCGYFTSIEAEPSTATLRNNHGSYSRGNYHTNQKN